MAKKKKAAGKPTKKKAPPLVIPILPAILPPITEVKTAALQTAIITHDTQTFQRLINHYNHQTNLQTLDVNGSTLIHIAIRNNDLSTLCTLLEQSRIDVNIKESNRVGGCTALHVACKQNMVEFVRVLLQARANPDIKCDSLNGETALMICCKYGNINCARLLLEAGALMDIKDGFGNTASFWAMKYNQNFMIRELELPPIKQPTANEFLDLMKQRIPGFVLPAIKVKKDKKDKKDKKGKKK